MGVRGRNPLDIMLFGSTAQHVVRHAACPVLTISEAS
jgi:nucleotide-binding universal stress UspA family protein